MKARYHVALSAALSLPFLFVGECWMALACLLFGIFIDVDHQLDFYLLFGRFTWSITELSEELKEHNNPVFFCPLHSLEFIILLVLLSWWFGMFIGAVVSVTAHLITDVLFNKLFNRHKELDPELDPFRSFFLYRARGELRLYEEFRRNYTDKK